jgi:hypothetical protein
LIVALLLGLRKLSPNFVLSLAPDQAVPHLGVSNVGFNILCAYRKHKTCVHEVSYIPEKNVFASVDDLALRWWHSTDKNLDQTETLKDMHFPNGRGRFVTAMAFAPKARSLFCACLDGHLRIYKQNFKLRASLKWPESIVHTMVFSQRRDELVVAGAAGVKERYPTNAFKPNLHEWFSVFSLRHIACGCAGQHIS